MKNKVNITIKTSGIPFTNSKYKKLGSGWHNESARHSLARRGYNTLSGMENNLVRKYPNLDFDNDGLKNKDDCEPFNDKEQGKIHDFLNKALDILKDKNLKDPEKIAKIEEARKEIGKITTKEKFKEWIRNHKKTLAIAGGGAFVVGVISAIILGNQYNIMMPTQVPITVELLRSAVAFTGGGGTYIGIKETIEGQEEADIEKEILNEPASEKTLKKLEDIQRLEESKYKGGIQVIDELE